jgi:exosortase A
VDQGIKFTPQAATRFQAWQGLVIAAVLLCAFAIYFRTAASIVSIWDSSGTFAHGYVILPITLWLVWQRRASLAEVRMQPYWPALAGIAACGFAWMLGELGEVQTVRQYAFAAMLPLSVLAVCGLPMARRMAFPLFFIMFAVPFGEVFIDPLINLTADFTVKALVATGIPVYREGNNFTIPTGSWSVVEACSGVRYLISSVTLGSLYAYLTYRSGKRRALFVLMSIIVPIIANGLRAYMIVMIGHLSGMKYAVGFDHLIYGWVFFGLVMFLLFWIGSHWREDLAPAGAPQPPQAAVAPAAAPGPLALAVLAVAASLAVWPAWLLYLEKSTPPAPAPQLAQIASADAPAAPFAPAWQPAFPEPAARMQQYFTHDASPVGLKVLYYRQPPEGVKMISSVNHIVALHQDEWRETGVAKRTVATGASTLNVRETMVAGGGTRFVVWSWYVIDGRNTSNDYLGKALQVQQKLFHGTDDGALVLVYAPYDEKPEPARAVLRSFLASHLGALDASLAARQRH